MRPQADFWSTGISSCLMKYIVSMPLEGPLTPYVKLPISFAKNIVHYSLTPLLAFLVILWYSIASHVSSSTINSVYPGRLACFPASILI